MSPASLRVLRAVLPVLLILGFHDLALASFEYGNRRLAATATELLAQFVFAFVALTVMGAIFMIIGDIRRWLRRRFGEDRREDDHSRDL
jgi:TRAP-type C4-dicarboxylate transport system permease small subunit